MHEPSPRRFDRLDYIYKLFIVIALALIAMVWAADIIIPFAFAGILSVVMMPLVKRLEARRVAPALAISLVLLMTIVVLGLLIWLMVGQIMGLVADLPNLQTKLETFINQASNTLRDFGVGTADQNKMVADAMRTVSTFLATIVLSTTNVLSALVQIPIYIFLLLIYRDKFQAFFLALLPGREFGWKKDVERVIQGYISGLFLVTMIIAALNTVGLLIVGIDHAIFFGILSGVLTVIPYVGIIIGALFPIVMALITKDSAWYAIGVVIVFTIVQFLEGNFITPRITGSKVSINALAAILALLIGGKVLGIAGMILAVPGIGLLKILLSYTRHLKPFVILLEDTPTQKELPPDIEQTPEDPAAVTPS
ncbi:AI-2E family transporter [Dawidia soli]|uniref:AI-2E family transporter n=1 Tax=Dawidia soli TaxID=2782352 RepID=A0AAP2GG35_9BACT|nr:AI-2E family transporter [Dawidia soli]MBT1685115.1 AI-2E family transporter [Dawidia soli]